MWGDAGKVDFWWIQCKNIHLNVVIPIQKYIFFKWYYTCPFSGHHTSHAHKHLCKQADIHTASSLCSLRNFAFLASPWINKQHRQAARRAKIGLRMTGLLNKTWAIQRTYVCHFAEYILRNMCWKKWITCADITFTAGDDIKHAKLWCEFISVPRD